MAKNNDAPFAKDTIDVPVGKIVGYALAGIVILTLLIALFSSFYVVRSGQQAVILTWGEASMVAVGPGLHFKIPIAQDVVKFDVKTSKYETDAAAASSNWRRS